MDKNVSVDDPQVPSVPLHQIEKHLDHKTKKKKSLLRLY